MIWRPKSGSPKPWGFCEILTKRNYFLTFSIIKYSSFHLLDVPSSATVYQPCNLNTTEEGKLASASEASHVHGYVHTHHELTTCLSFWSPHVWTDVCAPTMNLPLRPISKRVSLHISNLHLEAARTLVVEDSVKKRPLFWGVFRLENTLKFGHWQGYQLLNLTTSSKNLSITIKSMEEYV